MHMYRLDRYYYCREGFSAFLPRVDTPDNMNDLSKVIDVDSLRDQLNETADPQLFFCVPRPPPRKLSGGLTCHHDMHILSSRSYIAASFESGWELYAIRL